MSENAGFVWDDDEDAQLLRFFDEGVSLNDISHRHGRTPAAILTRLVRHGRIHRDPATGHYFRLTPWCTRDEAKGG